jgi:hypothetical protein
LSDKKYTVREFWNLIGTLKQKDFGLTTYTAAFSLYNMVHLANDNSGRSPVNNYPANLANAPISPANAIKVRLFRTALDLWMMPYVPNS